MESNVWKQWDKQEDARLERVRSQEAYVELNNTYLAVERGDVRLTVTIANRLRVLVSIAYSVDDDLMRGWWAEEFMKLPRWTEV